MSLPLLFTQEMWQISRTIPDAVLLVFLALTLAINRLYLFFSGFRRKDWKRSPWWDALIAMGVGMVTATVTLLVTGIIAPAADIYMNAKLIALETIPMSIGAAVATNQLGSGDSAGSDDNLPIGLDLRVLLGSLLGGFLFAFNIAPTMETKIIVLSQDWWMILATFVLSLGISYLTVAVANFEHRDLSERNVINSEWLEALMSYMVAFALSMLLLWVFGYGTPFDPLEVWLPQTIALAYATTLGGAAGRLVL